MENRPWQVAVTVGSLKRVKSVLGVDLTDLTSGDPPLLTRLGMDVVLLCDVIYVLCQPEADKRGITDEDFGIGLGGDAILSASEAFWGELIDFFQQVRRQDQATAISKQLAMVMAAVKAADKQIQGMDTDGMIDRIFSDTATKSQGSSE
jgi:hypothetical protein